MTYWLNSSVPLAEDSFSCAVEMSSTGGHLLQQHVTVLGHYFTLSHSVSHILSIQYCITLFILSLDTMFTLLTTLALQHHFNSTQL